LEPFVRAARARGNGVLVVASSSNPEGRQLQQAATAGDLTVADAVLAGVADLNRAEGFGLGAVGAVVGATVTDLRFDLALLGGVVLAPGVGAQGAGAKEVGAVFGGCPPGSVLPGASRSLLSRGPAARDLRSAAAQLSEELSAVLG
jgi:orotidine-5'-phosphate decarboxylase